MTPFSLPQGVQVFERGWLSANNIFCLDPAGANTTLIDTGYCTHSAQTLQLVAHGLKSHSTALNHIVNTHLHSDHCGGNAALQAAYPNAHTHIPPGHAHLVDVWDARNLSYELTQQDCPRFSYTHILQVGQTLQLGAQHWQIYAAGGHDPHSLILFEPQSRTLISADALWENGFGVVFPELEGIEAFYDVAATLDLIEGLQPKTVIPGHGKVFHYTGEQMATARSRLNFFIQNPDKHRRYAVKVLVTYCMLAQQRMRHTDLVAWCAQVPYLQLLNADLDADAFKVWSEDLIAELIRAKVLKTEKFADEVWVLA